MSQVYFSREELEQSYRQQLALLNAQVAAPGQAVLLQATRIDSLSLPDWIQVQQSPRKFYWRSRNLELELAGIGEAAHFLNPSPQTAECYDLLSSWINTHPQSEFLFAIGGNSFFPTISEGSIWKAFGAFHFVIPKLLILRKSSNYWGVVAIPFNQQSNFGSISQQIDQELENFPLTEENESPASTANFQLQSGTVEQYAWQNQINKALSYFETGRLQKVVLANEFLLQSSGHPAEPGLLLQKIKSQAKHHYCFYFQPDQHNAFLSLTPERLIRCNSDEVLCDAIAGTAPRGRTLQEDRLLRSSLLRDDKINREFEFVRSFLEQVFQQITRTYNADAQPGVLKLPHVQHLQIKFHGERDPEVSLGRMVEYLHPTPAVGGTPSTPALEFIQRHENFERGWYAAPVGVLGQKFAELAVGIRSTLLAQNSVRVFAGAGIVPGSDPEEEWQELLYKIAGSLKGLSSSGESIDRRSNQSVSGL